MKNEKFQEIIENLTNAELIWDWDEQVVAVDNNIESFIERNPSPSQIAEYINALAASCIQYDHEEFSYACRQILDTCSSVETLTTIIKTLSHLKNKQYYADDISEIFMKIIDEHPQRVDQIRTIAKKNGFDGVFAHKIFSEPKMLKMLETVNTAQKNNDKKALKRFKVKLSKMSDKEIYQIDHAAMTYLVNNFTQENFEKVNNLRAYWGLKAVVSEESLIEKNLRDIKRMEFSHNVSETDKSNPHYEHTYSDVYKKFVSNHSHNASFKIEQYTDALAESPAVKMLEDHGFSSFVEQLPEVLKKACVPPNLVPKLYIKDLQHLLIEHHSSEISNRYRRSIFDLDEVDIHHEADEVRAAFWREVVKDKDLVRFISQDLKKKGIDQETIEKIWERAKVYGNPNERVRKYDRCNDTMCDDTVRSVYFNVHHRVALKDGGTNTSDNFVIVIKIPGVVNSHLPLHEYDDPLIHLYKHKNVGEDGIIISDQPKSKEDKPIRLNTVFVADEENIRKNINKRVLYYGGPKAAMYVGKVHKAIRSKLNTIENVYKRIYRDRRQKKLLPQNNTPDQSHFEETPDKIDPPISNRKPRRPPTITTKTPITNES